MLYISSKKDGKLGVMDTEDGVEDFCTKEEIDNYIKQCNLQIITHKKMQAVLDYIPCYCLNRADIGSEGWLDVCEYVRTGDKSKIKFGGSKYDYAMSVYKKYQSLKTVDSSAIFEIYESNDLLIKDLISLYNIHRNIDDYSKLDQVVKEAIAKFNKKWHLADLDFHMYE
jgi:hypothetical protein